MRSARFVRVAAKDLSLATFHTIVNVVAGSAFLPRPARAAVYRLMGIDAETINIFPGSQITGRNVHLGARTFVNHGCYLEVDPGGRIDIGEQCLLSPGVMVLSSSHDLDPAGRVQPRTRPNHTVIGDRVWLGARSTVMPGVRIGDGCVVAAGAVVTKDCAPHGLYAGVPARRIRDFEPATEEGG